ncbi:MAG: pyrroline-5-carboxylate reductase [Polaromonas sp.]|uniref:pyrroline-5-carboxylate reductase n=1 Tax=Polaromonas sp. TaxID=1869339 RepID=UPI002734697A|nr:pyrroline-5-carboxylate reductase [Polaromonas sp.]MDP2820300.1 pyrroline-5-carboxylate reductase [Polaromonas sp.]
MTSVPASSPSADNIAFIGGGNMASAIIGGLLKQGLPASQIQIVEPWAEQRSKLEADFGITAQAAPGAGLAAAALVVWAVKPQTFRQAAQQAGSYTRQALHMSVAAGIRSSSMAAWLGTQRIVRAMPNTPALVGQGMTALFARAAVSAADRLAVERVIQPTGELLWLDQESQLDAVTALSGSGPAYVFYFLEAMVQAGSAMGLSREQAHQLAVQTFVGASALAKASSEPPETLRERVTSKGGTTYAALTAMEQSGVKQHFMQAIQAANQRAAELGDEYGSA